MTIVNIVEEFFEKLDKKEKDSFFSSYNSKENILNRINEYLRELDKSLFIG